jgi:hypothetical protein
VPTPRASKPSAHKLRTSTSRSWGSSSRISSLGSGTELKYGRCTGRVPHVFRTDSGLFASILPMLRSAIAIIALCAALTAAWGCGSSSRSTSTGTASAAAAGSAEGRGAGALSAEAKSAATGDIPDNQMYLTYKSPSEGFSMFYPEGWALRGSGRDVTISDKNNIVHIVISSAGAPSAASVSSELSALKRANPTLRFGAPATIQLKSGPALKASYSARSEPNPVTGKSVLLLVDRYELTRGVKRATIDLGTPQGVDNVDAYRKMINSFQWQ